MKFIYILIIVLLIFVIDNNFIVANEVYNSDNSKTYYDILEVDLNADTAEIKKQYRKLAKENHPDKAVNDQDKQKKHDLFVKIGSAYQVLSDETLRVRYNYLLSKNIYVYDDRAVNWEEFDRTRGKGSHSISSHTNYDGKTVFVFKDAYQQFQDEADDKALKISFSISLLFAIIPAIMYYYKKYQQSKSKVINKEQIKKDSETYKEYMKLQKEQELMEKELQKKELLELKRLREEKIKLLEAEGAFDVPDEIKELLNESDAVTTDRNNISNEDENINESNNNKDGLSNEINNNNNKQIFKCNICKKSYKSQNQLDQHFQTKDHIKAEKNANRIKK